MASQNLLYVLRRLGVERHPEMLETVLLFKIKNDAWRKGRNDPTRAKHLEDDRNKPLDALHAVLDQDEITILVDGLPEVTLQEIRSAIREQKQSEQKEKKEGDQLVGQI